LQEQSRIFLFVQEACQGRTARQYMRFGRKATFLLGKAQILPATLCAKDNFRLKVLSEVNQTDCMPVVRKVAGVRFLHTVCREVHATK
jgi:hypothetical protein